jgi:hypothetical protein
LSSEYDSPFAFRRPSPEAEAELAAVRARFQAAAGPYLASPWTWLCWGVVLALAAVATPAAARLGRFAGVLLLWSGAIVVAGSFEAWSFWQRGGGRGSLLAGWALRAQGNLSLVALLVSALLVWRGEAEALPGLWLLVLGHSFYILGGLSFPALARFGLAYQLGGSVALFAGSRALSIFAVTALVANLGLALATLRKPKPAS